MHRIFDSLSDEDRVCLEALFTKTEYGPGETVIREGEQHGALFFLREGALRVEPALNNRPVPIALMVPGEMFGEVAFLTGAGASTSVVAERYSVLDVIRQSALEAVLADRPEMAARFYKALSTMLAQRLKQNTRPIVHPTSWK